MLWKWWRRKLQVSEPPVVGPLPPLKPEPGLGFPHSFICLNPLFSPRVLALRDSPIPSVHVLLTSAPSRALGIEKGKKIFLFLNWLSGRGTDMQTYHCVSEWHVLWQKDAQRLGAGRSDIQPSFWEGGDRENLEGRRMLGLRLESRVRFHLVQVRGDSFLAAGTARARAGNQEKASRLGSQVHSSGLGEE